MTALSTVSSPDITHASLSAGLLDALSEAVIAPADPGARSAVICSLVQEVCASLEWRHEGVDDRDAAAHVELVSIRQLAEVAHDHHLRMHALGASMAEEHGP